LTNCCKFRPVLAASLATARAGLRQWDRKSHGLNGAAHKSGCRHNQWIWFSGWKIGYRCADRSAGDGLEGHGNASRRQIGNIVSWTVKLTGDASNNRPANNHNRTTLAQAGVANENSFAGEVAGLVATAFRLR
jgi:hypothetical protein